MVLARFRGFWYSRARVKHTKRSNDPRSGVATPAENDSEGDHALPSTATQKRLTVTAEFALGESDRRYHTLQGL